MRRKEIELIISKREITLNGKNYADDLLKDGIRVITKAHNNQKVFLMNGRPVSSELGEIFGLFIPMPR